MPTEEELKEFLRIPKTSLGKLEAMNKCFLKEENLEGAFKQMLLFMDYLTKNNPDYIEALKKCKTEEEIKKISEEFFKNNPRMIEEVDMNLIAAKRDRIFNKKEESEKK